MIGAEVDPLLIMDANIAKRAIERTDGDWKTKLFAGWQAVDEQSMQSSRWGVVWDDWRLRAGIAGLLLFYGTQDGGEQSQSYLHIQHECKMINRLNTLLSSARQGLGMTLMDALEGTEEDSEKYPPIGLFPWFKEWKEQYERMRDPNWRRASRLAKELAEHCKQHKIAGTFHGITIA